MTHSDGQVLDVEPTRSTAPESLAFNSVGGGTGAQRWIARIIAQRRDELYCGRKGASASMPPETESSSEGNQRGQLGVARFALQELSANAISTQSTATATQASTTSTFSERLLLAVKGKHGASPLAALAAVRAVAKSLPSRPESSAVTQVGHLEPTRDLSRALHQLEDVERELRRPTPSRRPAAQSASRQQQAIASLAAPSRSVVAGDDIAAETHHPSRLPSHRTCDDVAGCIEVLQHVEERAAAAAAVRNANCLVQAGVSTFILAEGAPTTATSVASALLRGLEGHELLGGASGISHAAAAPAVPFVLSTGGALRGGMRGIARARAGDCPPAPVEVFAPHAESLLAEVGIGSNVAAGCVGALLTAGGAAAMTSAAVGFDRLPCTAILDARPTPTIDRAAQQIAHAALAPLRAVAAALDLASDGALAAVLRFDLRRKSHEGLWQGGRSPSADVMRPESVELRGHVVLQAAGWNRALDVLVRERTDVLPAFHVNSPSLTDALLPSAGDGSGARRSVRSLAARLCGLIRHRPPQPQQQSREGDAAGAAWVPYVVRILNLAADLELAARARVREDAASEDGSTLHQRRGALLGRLQAALLESGLTAAPATALQLARAFLAPGEAAAAAPFGPDAARAASPLAAAARLRIVALQLVAGCVQHILFLSAPIALVDVGPRPGDAAGGLHSCAARDLCATLQLLAPGATWFVPGIDALRRWEDAARCCDRTGPGGDASVQVAAMEAALKSPVAQQGGAADPLTVLLRWCTRVVSSDADHGGSSQRQCRASVPTWEDLCNHRVGPAQSVVAASRWLRDAFWIDDAATSSGTDRGHDWPFFAQAVDAGATVPARMWPCQIPAPHTAASAAARIVVIRRTAHVEGVHEVTRETCVNALHDMCKRVLGCGLPSLPADVVLSDSDRIGVDTDSAQAVAVARVLRVLGELFVHGSWAQTAAAARFYSTLRFMRRLAPVLHALRRVGAVDGVNGARDEAAAAEASARWLQIFDPRATHPTLTRDAVTGTLVTPAGHTALTASAAAAFGPAARAVVAGLSLLGLRCGSAGTDPLAGAPAALDAAVQHNAADVEIVVWGDSDADDADNAATGSTSRGATTRDAASASGLEAVLEWLQPSALHLGAPNATMSAAAVGTHHINDDLSLGSSTMGGVRGLMARQNRAQQALAAAARGPLNAVAAGSDACVLCGGAVVAICSPTAARRLDHAAATALKRWFVPVVQAAARARMAAVACRRRRMQRRSAFIAQFVHPWIAAMASARIARSLWRTRYVTKRQERLLRSGTLRLPGQIDEGSSWDARADGGGGDDEDFGEGFTYDGPTPRERLAALRSLQTPRGHAAARDGDDGVSDVARTIVDPRAVTHFDAALAATTDPLLLWELEQTVEAAERGHAQQQAALASEKNMWDATGRVGYRAALSEAVAARLRTMWMIEATERVDVRAAEIRARRLCLAQLYYFNPTARLMEAERFARLRVRREQDAVARDIFAFHCEAFARSVIAATEAQTLHYAVRRFCAVLRGALFEAEVRHRNEIARQEDEMFALLSTQSPVVAHLGDLQALVVSNIAARSRFEEDLAVAVEAQRAEQRRLLEAQRHQHQSFLGSEELLLPPPPLLRVVTDTPAVQQRRLWYALTDQLLCRVVAECTALVRDEVRRRTALQHAQAANAIEAEEAAARRTIRVAQWADQHRARSGFDQRRCTLLELHLRLKWMLAERIARAELDARRSLIGAELELLNALREDFAARCAHTRRAELLWAAVATEAISPSALLQRVEAQRAQVRAALAEARQIAATGGAENGVRALEWPTETHRYLPGEGGSVAGSSRRGRLQRRRVSWTDQEAQQAVGTAAANVFDSGRVVSIALPRRVRPGGGDELFQESLNQQDTDLAPGVASSVRPMPYAGASGQAQAANPPGLYQALTSALSAPRLPGSGRHRRQSPPAAPSVAASARPVWSSRAVRGVRDAGADALAAADSVLAAAGATVHAAVAVPPPPHRSVPTQPKGGR